MADGLAANETALAQSSQNAGNATGLLQTADGALSQVTTLLNRAVTLATQAANSTLTTSQISSANQEYQNILTQIGNIGAKTNYNGSGVFSGTAKSFFVSDGTTAGSTTYNDIVGTLSTASIGTTTGVAASSTAVSLTTPVASSSSVPSTTTLTLGAATHTVSGTLSLAVGAGATHALTLASGSTLSDVANQINSDATFSAASVTAAYSTSTHALTITGPTAASSTLVTTGTILSDTTAPTVGAGEDFTASGIATLSAGSAQDVLSALTSAIGDVAYQRGTIGANINQLSSAESVAANEQTNLTAAEDSIRATDYGQAASNLSKYQVLSQTGISALAQANSVQQEVTKLLQ